MTLCGRALAGRRKKNSYIHIPGGGRVGSRIGYAPPRAIPDPVQVAKGVSKPPRLVIWLMQSSLRQILSPNNHIQPDHVDR